MSVFYRVPSKFGYFDPVKNNYHSLDENSEGLRNKGDNESQSLNMLKSVFRG